MAPGKSNRVRPDLVRKHFQEEEHPHYESTTFTIDSSSMGQFGNDGETSSGATDTPSVYGLQQKTLYVSFKYSLLGAMCTLILSPILLLTIISITFSLITANQIETLVVDNAVQKANAYVSNFLDKCILLASAQRQQVFDNYYMKYSDDSLFYSPENYLSIFKTLSMFHAQHKNSVFLMDFTPPNGDYLYVSEVDSSENPSDDNLQWSQKFYDRGQKMFFTYNTQYSNTTTYLDTYQITNNGTFVSLTKQEDYPQYYDPRNDEFYRLSHIYKTAITPIALQVEDLIEEQVYVSYQESIYSPFNTSQYIGVVSSTVVIKYLAEFVQSFKFSTNGVIGIIELNKNEDGTYRKRVIAYKDLSALVIKNSDGTLKIPEADEIPDDMLRHIVTNIIPSTTEKLYAGRKILNRYLYGSANLMSFDVVSSSQGFNIEWLVFISAPEIDFVGNLVLMICLNVVVSVIFIVVSIVIAYYISVKVSRPLAYFSTESKAISRLEVNRSLPLKTRIREIIELGDAFDKMKTTLRSFMRFVPKHLIVEMVEKGIEMKLGGAMLDNITILFSDVENFTTWSEELSPQLLINHVSEYFHVMTEEIVQEQGTLDKYIGDSVMALWGAPTRMLNTALPACRAAIKCQKAMRKLREKWKLEGKPLFRCRIGLHTGSCIVGNIGSVWRLNYTCMGDAVNLASRLEGQNKVYGTEVLISEATAAQPEVFETFALRKLDKVSVKGKSVGCTVYELQSKNTNYSSTFYSKQGVGEHTPFVQKYEAALELYFSGNFHHALSEFQDCAEMFAADKATQTMIERCTFYLQHPPNDWTGVHSASEK